METNIAQREDNSMESDGWPTPMIEPSATNDYRPNDKEQGQVQGLPCQQEIAFPFKYLVSPSGESAERQLWASPVQLSIALKSSPFAEALMDKPQINKDMRLGAWEITCKLLTPFASSFGVIGPIDLEEDLMEIKSLLLSDGYPITDIRRILKRASGKTISTKCIKLSFSVKDLPSRVIICGVPYMVKPFSPSVRQCYNCQRFGHLAKSCKSKARCLYCAADHAFKDCSKEAKKCANCKGEHLANYGGCHFIQRAQKVEILAWRSGKSYSVALEQITSSSNDGNDSRPQGFLSNPNSGNYSGGQSLNQGTNTVTYAGVTSGTNAMVNNSLQSATVENALSKKIDMLAEALQSILKCFGEIVQSFNLESGTSANSSIVDKLQTLNKISSDIGKSQCQKPSAATKPVINQESKETEANAVGKTTKIPEIKKNKNTKVPISKSKSNKTNNSGTPALSQPSDSIKKGKRTSSDAALTSSQPELSMVKKTSKISK